VDSVIDVNAFLPEILVQAQSQMSNYWIEKLLSFNYKRVHLAILNEPYLSLILDGTKTIESRFSQKRMIPYRQVDKGDIIILKKSGGAIVGLFEANTIDYFEPFNTDDVIKIKSEYNERLCCSDDFWSQKSTSRYATLIKIENLFKLESIRASFKNRQAWILGAELHERPTIICVSGEIASGKTYIANKLSEALNCRRYSVSDFLRSIAHDREQNDPSREYLQRLGKEQMEDGWEKFCKNFVSFTEWRSSGYLIVDGVRHIEFLQSFSDLIRPWGKAISVYVSTDIKTRERRLTERGETIKDANHAAEGDLSKIRKCADIYIDNNDEPNQNPVMESIRKLFAIKLTEAPYGLF
jgi:dephospho-CoA kinase/ASC-1-like (ASCH) protein